jgi:YVTN family beta-propeller protein
MKKKFLVIVIVCIGMLTQAQESKKIILPNGWALSPAGTSLSLGDLPLNMAVSKSKKLMAVTNNGQGKQSIQLINLVSNTILDNINIEKSWLGIAFSADEKNLYTSGGNDNWILKYNLVNNKLILTDSIQLGEKWPNKISPAGICINDAKNILYVVTKDDNSLYEVNLITKKIMNRIALPAESYTCILSNDKSELYISVWGAEKLVVYNTLSQKITNSITTGTHPNDLILSKNGKIIYVANGEDNSVSVIDIKNRKVIETLNCALYPNAPAGSATNGVALSTDEKTLYIANADNNCLAVFDVTAVGNSKSKGFIPVGWYPTSVKVVGSKIYVTNGKGFSSFANPLGPDPYNQNAQMLSLIHI